MGTTLVRPAGGACEPRQQRRLAPAARRRRARRAPPARVGGYAPIGGYAAIGDPTAFGALLDAERGGSFRLAPDGDYRVARRYVPRTNVLETTFETDDGAVRVTDALTLQDGGIVPWVELARQVECVSGRVRMRWSVEPRFGYGAEETEVTQLGGTPVALGKRLRLAVFAWDLGPPQRSATAVAGVVDLREGESGLVACVATDGEPVPYPPRDEVLTRLRGTVRSWRRWLEGNRYEGPWRPAVERSALALKLLTYTPSGAMAAAGTSCLPERIGGDRNFDYRYSWIRDTAFTLDALAGLGHRQEVHASLSWLLRVTDSTHPRMQPLYGFDGQVPKTTTTLPVEGYRGTGPVVRGNSAATQLQLGNYGDLFETVWYYVQHGNNLDPATGLRLAEIASLVCEIWRNEDSGIWELDERRHYTISKMACWVALTRASELAQQGLVPKDDVERWRETAAEVRNFVETRCWSEEKRSYTFYADGDALDCGVLLASLSGYADPRDERLTATIDALRSELTADGPLLYRYSGMRGEEGCFLACSFWMVAALARAGRLDEARSTMDELVALGNDVGLYSEEQDPATLELLGNFPQALTHLSLIRAAAAVAEAERENGGAR